METESKSPVEIVQELIAIHTTRKEAAEKLSNSNSEGFTIKLTGTAQQSDGFIKELINELSNFGDAVQETVNRENEYQVLWKSASANIESIDAAESERTFEEMEESLRRIYQTLLTNKSDLPASLSEIIVSQEGRL